MNTPLFSENQKRHSYKRLFNIFLPVLTVVLVIVITNSSDISCDKKERWIRYKLNPKLVNTIEKRAYMKSMLARRKANDEILKAIEEKRLKLQDSKEAPTLIIEQEKKED